VVTGGRGRKRRQGVAEDEEAEARCRGAGDGEETTERPLADVRFIAASFYYFSVSLSSLSLSLGGRSRDRLLSSPVGSETKCTASRVENAGDNEKKERSEDERSKINHPPLSLSSKNRFFSGQKKNERPRGGCSTLGRAARGGLAAPR
jgi:hypothetical protein